MCAECPTGCVIMGGGGGEHHTAAGTRGCGSMDREEARQRGGWLHPFQDA